MFIQYIQYGTPVSQAKKSIEEMLELIKNDVANEIGVSKNGNKKVFSSTISLNYIKDYLINKLAPEEIAQKYGKKNVQFIKDKITSALLTLNYRRGIGYRFSFGDIQKALKDVRL